MTKEDVFQQLLKEYINAKELLFDEHCPSEDFCLFDWTAKKWALAQGQKFLEMWQNTGIKTINEYRYRYPVSSEGIILDTETGLEWYTGLDVDTTWDEAEAWVKELNSKKFAGGNWRLPILNELQRIYEKNKVSGKYEIQIDPVFGLNGIWVWGSTEKPDFLYAFGFNDYRQRSRSHATSYYARVFAVRSSK